jgi:glycosyltransferase involved in cell wall biosynthesis
VETITWYALKYGQPSAGKMAKSNIRRAGIGRNADAPDRRNAVSGAHGTGTKLAEDGFSRVARSGVRPKVLVFGPYQPPTVACGISSAIRAFSGSRVGEHYDVEIVSTFRPDRNRGLTERLAYGVCRLAGTFVRTMWARAEIVDIYSASGRSLLSHAAVLFGARLAGRPALLRIHGGDFYGAFQRASSPQRALIRAILRAATRVIVLSESWRRKVLSIEPRVAIEVVPNSIDCKALSGAGARPSREPRRILFLANFSEQKGHFEALEALRQLAPKFPNVTLALAGADREPGMRQRLEHESKRSGILRHIEFLGTISAEAKEKALFDADILILPSHMENMPVSVMEGMAAALPVVATTVGALEDMIDDGKTGCLIEPGNADALAQRLDMLLRDAALCRRIGHSARRHAQTTWDADLVAETNLILYARVLEPRSAVSA